MKTALIFGVSGQDGSFLAEFLLKKNYRVIGVSRDAMGSTFHNLNTLGIRSRIELRSASIHDFRSVLQVIKQEEPDEIYNLAGQSSVGLSFEQPVETFESISIANLNLLEVIRFLNQPMIKLYNAGSSEIYGNSGQKKITEKSKLRPRSPYGVAKAAALLQIANYREAYNIYACTGILFNHESFLRPERFVTKKIIKTACRIKKGIDKKLKLGNINIKRDWGWAPEYVEAMWLMMQQDIADDYIVATGKTYSLGQFVETAFSTLELDWHKYVETDSSLLRPSDIESIYANPKKAKNKLGWKAKNKMPAVVEKMIKKEMEI